MRTGVSFDDVLVAAQAGAGWAFEVLYRDLSPSVTGYLRLHGAAEPDDLPARRSSGSSPAWPASAATRRPCVPGSSRSPTAGWSTTGAGAAAGRR